MRKKIIYSLSSASVATTLLASYLYYYEPSKQIYAGIYRSSNLIKTFIKSFVTYHQAGDISEKHAQAAIYLREALEKNAGIYIKLGQVIASVEVLVPQEYINELSKLFERAPVTPFPKVMEVLENSLGASWRNFFTEIESLPIAAGSIAQVHVAKLLNGKKVAIKIQHPHLSETLKYDIAICEILIRMLNFFAKDYNFYWMVEDMKKYLPIELNFNIEVSNCLRLQELFKGDRKIRTPSIYLDLCSEKVIVMEYINGYSISNIDRLQKDKIPLREVAKHISKAFNKMIFQIGFIHGDPHPGNIFIEPLRKDYKIVLLDHGLYRVMSLDTRVSYAKLWTGIVTQKEKLIKEACEEFNIKSFYKTFTSIVTYQDYNEIINSKEKSVVKRLNDLRNDNERMTQSLKKAGQNRKVIFKCLEEMNQELLLVLKVNSYLDTIEGKLGPKYYNIYFTAKSAFELYLTNINSTSYSLRKKLSVFFMSIYFRFVLFALIFYDWRSSLKLSF